MLQKVPEDVAPLSGCIGSAGNQQDGKEQLEKCHAALNSIDERMVIFSCESHPEIQYLYTAFLDKPGSDLAHKLLHLHSVPGDAPTLQGHSRRLDRAGLWLQTLTGILKDEQMCL
jgi:hypothetical protein